MKPIWKQKPILKKKDMNWAEAKWANPRLKPNQDYDRDGVKNQFDCRPMNRKRQHAPEARESDSKFKRQMIEDFSIMGDFRHFAEGKGKKDEY